MGYALTTQIDRPFEHALQQTREALAGQGFGILTEIDIRSTLRAKLDVDVQPQVILGACRPPLAHQALQLDPSIGLLLPCNVVVRAIDDTHTTIEAMDPHIMVEVTGNPALLEVAADARARLAEALHEVAQVAA